jgi:beta-lactamase class A
MRLSRILLYVLIFLLGAFAGYAVRDSFAPHSDVLDFESIRNTKYKYTHPLLDVLIANNSPQNTVLRPFKKHIEKLIREDLDSRWANQVAVYFRDLNNGPWFDIGEMTHFFPASLLKVPLLMAVLKQAETKPAILKQKIKYDDPDLKKKRNLSSNNLEFGRNYAIDTLLDNMITHSDNVATLLLFKFVDKEILEQTYIQLGIIDDTSGPERANLLDPSLPEHRFTIPQYASFFRVLYNGSYLNRAMSEKALGLLARADFKSGIVAGVPTTVEVAHKWGYRELGEIRQLHDCGIVYYPKAPYLLCVMTSGDSYDHLDEAIREISRAVFTEVDLQKTRGK